MTQRHNRSRTENDQHIEPSIQQKAVFEALIQRDSERYPLSQWYLGAIYALSNPYNPDRHSQAAQSLRELLEKLPRVIQETPMQISNPQMVQTQRELHSQISKAAERYQWEWSGKPIDSDLSKTLDAAEEYFRLRQQPSRRELITRTVATIDPLFYQMNTDVRNRKLGELSDVWRELEAYAHHRSPDTETFGGIMERLEHIILDLLAPIRADNQQEIDAILQKSEKLPEDAVKMLELIEKNGANYAFFFVHADDIWWLNALKENNYFSNPPAPEQLGSDLSMLPNWWPMRFLVRIARRAPAEVVEIVQQLPESNNPRIYADYLEIALRLPPEQSVKLQPQVIRYASTSLRPLSHRFPELLIYWTGHDQVAPALELAKPLVYFDTDPEREDKWELRQAHEADWTTALRPRPRLEQRDYLKVMQEGMRALAGAAPYETASILISAVNRFILDGIHQEERHQRGMEDYSEVSWPHLKATAGEHLRESNSLLFTTTYACEQVYEKSPDLLATLDGNLRNRQWKVFKRLRHHLYAHYLNEQTREWIRDEIIQYSDYGRRTHTYEFQQMIRNATEEYGADFVGQGDLRTIFEKILEGPSKEEFRQVVGEENYSDELFEDRKRRFHRAQLHPFRTVLFGDFLAYFQRIEDEADSPITEQHYRAAGTFRTGGVTNESPKTSDELAVLSDEGLLNFINEWDDEHRDPEDSFKEVTFEALAKAFESFFETYVMSNHERLSFWFEHRDRIQRPIFVRAMLNAMCTRIKSRDLTNLNRWLETAEWVLSHPDGKRQPTFGPEDTSRDSPRWGECRLTVARMLGDLTSLYGKNDDLNTMDCQEQILTLFYTLCTQYDGGLDEQESASLGEWDLMSESLNHPRSLALEYFIRFGFLARKRDPHFDPAALKRALEARFLSEADAPLSLPERAILGRYYPDLLDLDGTWASQRKSDIFPQNNQRGWVVAFGGFLECLTIDERLLEVLRDDFELALSCQSFQEEHRPPFTPMFNFLGQQLFAYFRIGLIPMRGQDSLIERFYNATEKHRARWADLFDHVGWWLYHRETQLDTEVRDRVINFFQWRVEIGDKTELSRIGLWLEATCLDQEWRLYACSEVLDACRSVGAPDEIDWGKIAEMIPEHTAEVVKCFGKFTDGVQYKKFFLQKSAARAIINAGLNSDDLETQENARRARNTLLNSGLLDILDLQDVSIC